MKKATYLLTSVLIAWLKEYAYKNKISQSSIVRDALKVYKEAAGGKTSFKRVKRTPKKKPKLKKLLPFELAGGTIKLCKHGMAKGLCKLGCK